MAHGLGSEYDLYAGATLQTGDDRYSPSNYTQLLLLQSFSFTIDGETHDVSTMDDGFDRAHAAGRLTISAAMNGLFNHTGDAGFEIVETGILGATDAARLLAYLWTTGTAGKKEGYFEGYPSQIVYTFPDNSPSTFSCNVVVNTASWAPQDTT